MRRLKLGSHRCGSAGVDDRLAYSITELGLVGSSVLSSVSYLQMWGMTRYRLTLRRSSQARLDSPSVVPRVPQRDGSIENSRPFSMVWDKIPMPLKLESVISLGRLE